MTASILSAPKPALDLPPAFSWVAPPPAVPVQRFACEAAPFLGAGTLTSRVGPQVLELAVVLEPEELLCTAKRAILVCMAALADAVGACAPPEKPVTLIYPDVIAFDGARLGGGRITWPPGCSDDEVPAWIVFSAMLLLSKDHAGDPGFTPNSTALDEEGFEPQVATAVVEAFARYLLLGFDAVRDRGFELWSEAYRRWMPDGWTARIDAAGNLRTDEGNSDLAPALDTVSWFDPQAGAPRL